MSATMRRIDPPSPTEGLIVSTAASSFDSVRPQIETWAPSAASRAADASPMPLPPPVTSAVRPVMEVLMPSPSHADGLGRREPDAHRLVAADEVGRTVRWLRVVEQVHVRQPVEHRRERDLELEPGQCRTEA